MAVSTMTYWLYFIFHPAKHSSCSMQSFNKKTVSDQLVMVPFKSDNLSTWAPLHFFSCDCTATFKDHNWTATSEFGTYRLCEQRRFRRACAFAQSCQNLRCSLIQAVSQEEHSDRKPDPWPLWMAGHAQLKFVMTECSKTQIRLAWLNYSLFLISSFLHFHNSEHFSLAVRICPEYFHLTKMLIIAIVSSELQFEHQLPTTRTFLTTITAQREKLIVSREIVYSCWTAQYWQNEWVLNVTFIPLVNHSAV